MLDRVGFGALIVAHLKTLRSYRTRRYRVRDLAFFFVLPAAVATAIVIFDISILPITDMIVIVVSIFAGLLFSLLILVYESALRQREPGVRETIRRDLLEQAYANTAFAILIAVPTVLTTLLPRLSKPGSWPEMIYSAIAVFLFGVFLLTLLLIIRRVGALMRSDVEAPQAPSRRLRASDRAAG